jgi:cbb3-type cytochrome oxidase subunit 1
MIQALKTMLADWNARYSERDKLQHAYLIAVVFGFMLAGLVGLLNYDASRAILRVCFAGLGIVLVNAIGWALLFSFVVNKLPAKTSNGKK